MDQWCRAFSYLSGETICPSWRAPDCRHSVKRLGRNNLDSVVAHHRRSFDRHCAKSSKFENMAYQPFRAIGTYLHDNAAFKSSSSRLPRRSCRRRSAFRTRRLWHSSSMISRRFVRFWNWLDTRCNSERKRRHRKQRIGCCTCSAVLV